MGVFRRKYRKILADPHQSFISLLCEQCYDCAVANRTKKTIFRIILILILVPVLIFTVTGADIWSYGNQDEKRDADVIIVLGAAAYESGVTPVFAERINHAAELFRQGYADRIILTGGVAYGNSVSDAWIASQYAIETGIPEDVLILEEKSAVTYENMKYSKEIMDEYGFDTAIIVSDPLHMRRAMEMAEDNGIKAYSSPTASTRYITLTTQVPFLFRETYTLLGYRIMRLLGIGPQ